MNIGKFSINNRYFVLSLTIMIVLFGIYAKTTLKTQLSPDTNAPMATVIVQYPGASAQDVIIDIVEPMEDEFGTLEGISKIKSTSQDNIASIQLKFKYGIDIDQAAIDVQNSINRIRGNLPSTMKEPKVLKFSTSDKPIMTLSLRSDSVELKDVRQLVEEKIGFDLQLVEGVASINLFGGNITEVQVNLDKNKLNAYGLTIDQVSKILSQNNIKSPGGKITDNGKEVLLRVEENFQNIDDIRNLRMPLSDGNAIYLKDIADVDLSIEGLESTYRLDGKNAIAVMITKKIDANTIEVVKNIGKEIERFKQEYPFIEFKIAQDDSIFTTQMVDNMIDNVFSALLLAVVIIILFLSNINQSLVVSFSMPLVLLCTLGLMKLFGMKLDMVTLSALMLSIGFIVDTTIVVVENIMTHYRVLGKDIVSAAIDGAQEIALPNIAGVTTTLIVLVPLIFIKGFVGEMFRPLALTVIFAISSASVISLIIVPLFTVLFDRFKFKRIENLIKIAAVPYNKLMNRILNIYVILLKSSLRNKAVMYVAIVLLIAVSGRFLAENGVEMLPKFDSGTTFVSVEMEPGTTLRDTTEAVNIIEKKLSREKNVIGSDTQIGYEKNSNLLGDFGIMGTNQAVITINLKPRTERKETIWEFQERLRAEIAQIPDIKRFVVKEKGGTATGSSLSPLDIRISGADQKLLYQIAEDLEEKIKEVEGTTNIYKSFNMDNLQLNIKMNNVRTQELGLTNANVAQQLYTSIEGIKNSTMDLEEADNVNISVGYMDKYNETIEDLLDVYISTPMGVKVPLRELASIDTRQRANIITKEDLEYTIDILGYTDGRAFSHITSDIQKILNSYPLPDGYMAKLSGENEDMADSIKDMAFLLAMAIVFVYLVLVPQFKSFIHPITIMAAIPLVIIGVAPSLWLTDKYISMPVLLGFILLVGTVVNNSIFVVEQAVANQSQGISIENSVIAAVKSRFRPIMMTALCDVTGMLPQALELGLGTERFSPLAITGIGGMLAATFLTMLVIPVLYTTFEEAKNKIFKTLPVQQA